MLDPEGDGVEKKIMAGGEREKNKTLQLQSCDFYLSWRATFSSKIHASC